MNTPLARAQAPLLEALASGQSADAEDFAILTRVAALVTGAPNAFISLVDDAGDWRHAGARQDGPYSPRDDTFCTAALREDEVLVVEDVRLDARTQAIAVRRGDAAIVTYAGALLKTEDGTKVGTLCVTDSVRRPISDAQVQLLRGLARQVMGLVSLRKTQRELTEALAKMTRLATTDDLTGLLNRRAFFEEAEGLRSLVLRQKGVLSVVVLDIDHFKKVNDHHGHAAGDAVLKEVSRRLRAALRSTDRIGRIGGEEFAIALPFTGQDAAMQLMRHLRVQVSQHPVMVDGLAIPVTFSGGVAALHGRGVVADAVRRADQALYRAKAAGRDQITEDAPCQV
jgi:diguanylate cyclase (GGDEF)-like protein